MNKAFSGSEIMSAGFNFISVNLSLEIKSTIMTNDKASIRTVQVKGRLKIKPFIILVLVHLVLSGFPILFIGATYFHLSLAEEL